MYELRIKPCPFCGGEMKFYHESFVNKYGQSVVYKYYQHANMGENCILDEICMPFIIPAGDSNEEKRYIGNYGEKWNKRAGVDEKEIN